MDRKECWVYTHYAADGHALYVGMTQNLHARTKWNHRKESPWREQVARVAVVGPFPRDVAMRLERFLIAARDPEFNIVGSPRLGYREQATHLVQLSGVA